MHTAAQRGGRPKIDQIPVFLPDFWGKWAVLVSTGILGPRAFISTEFRGFSLIPVPNGGHFDVFGSDFWDGKCLREAPEPPGAAGRPKKTNPDSLFWLLKIVCASVSVIYKK